MKSFITACALVGAMLFATIVEAGYSTTTKSKEKTRVREYAVAPQSYAIVERECVPIEPLVVHYAETNVLYAEREQSVLKLRPTIGSRMKANREQRKFNRSVQGELVTHRGAQGRYLVESHGSASLGAHQE